MKKLAVLMFTILIILGVAVGIFTYFFIDKKELLTVGNFYETLNRGKDECDAYGGLNHDEPDKIIRYSRPDGGIEFDIPYNKNGGTKNTG